MSEHTFAVIPAVYVLLAEPGRILLQLRQGTGYLDGHWACAVAGHIEEGESVLRAARREAREEIGVELGQLRALTTLHRCQGHEPRHQRVDYFVEAVAWEGEPAIQEPDKCADLRWFDLDALPEPLVPHERVVMEAYRDGAIEPIIELGFDADGVRRPG